MHGNYFLTTSLHPKQFIVISANGINREFGNEFTRPYDNKCAKKRVAAVKLALGLLTANRSIRQMSVGQSEGLTGVKKSTAASVTSW